tara:strand:+ start:24199 stop:25452 length:1254 start_codon:yes stop_codon:yes gene_type:complete
MPAPNPPLTLKHRVKSALAFVLGHAAAALLAAAGRLWRLRVWHLRDDRIGHLVGDTDLFLRRRELGEIEPGIRILGFSGKPCNAAIVNVFARQFRILRGPVVSWLYRLVEPYLERTGFVIASTTRTTEYREFAATLPLLRLTPEEEARGRAELAKMGIGENDWWVCFHARDAEYLGEQRGARFAYHSFRNHDIANMVPAMEFIAANGGFAIRLGSAVERHLAVADNPRIIDYAAGLRSDFMDLYLPARCRFFVGSTSGLFHIAKAFGVPYLMTNLIGYTHMSPQPNSLFVPKRVFGRNGAALDFDECAARGMFDPTASLSYFQGSRFADAGIEVVENSAEEILDAIEDMMDLVAGRPVDPDVAAKQRLFKERYYAQSADRHDAGSLAPSFIRRHWADLGPATIPTHRTAAPTAGGRT